MAQQAFRFTQATDGTITIGSGGAIAGATTITATGLITSAGLDATNQGLVNAGAIAGATTVNASGAITGGSFTDGTLTINAGSITNAVSVNASGAITGGSLTDGQATITGGAIAGATTITASGQISGVGVSAGAGALTGTGGSTVSGAMDYSGATNFTIGAFALPVTDGSANQVLKTDGAGTVTWAADSGASTPGAAGDILLSDGGGGFSIDASFNIDTTNELLQIGAGGSVYGAFKSNTTTISSGSATAIDSFAGAAYKGAKYVITAFDATTSESQTTELLVTADGSGSSFVPFADVFTSASPLFTVNVTSAASPSVELTRTGSNNLTVRFIRQTIA
jgi:hypothetical protein